MARKVTRHTGTLEGILEATGQAVRVDIFTEFHEGHSSSGNYSVAGLKKLLFGGKTVTHLGPGRLQVVETGEVITSPEVP